MSPVPNDPFDAPPPGGPIAPRDPIVLVADPVFRGEEWTQLRPLLRPGFDLIELPSAFEGTLGDVVTALEAALVRSNEYPVHVLSFSLGAATAIGLAGRRPDLFRSLIAVEPLAGPASADLEALLGPDGGDATGRDGAARARYAEGLGADPAWARTTFPDLGLPNPGAGPATIARRTVSELAATEPEELLAPVLAVVGSEAPAPLRRIARGVAQRYPTAVDLEVPAAPSFLPWLDPPRLAGIIGTFCLERNVPSA